MALVNKAPLLKTLTVIATYAKCVLLFAFLHHVTCNTKADGTVTDIIKLSTQLQFDVTE